MMACGPILYPPLWPDCVIIVGLPSRDCREGKTMSLMKSLTLAFALCLVTFCYVSPTSAQSQGNNPADSTQGDRDQPLKQILTEVRELRLTVQRATVSNTRFQM